MERKNGNVAKFWTPDLIPMLPEETPPELDSTERIIWKRTIVPVIQAGLMPVSAGDMAIEYCQIASLHPGDRSVKLGTRLNFLQKQLPLTISRQAAVREALAKMELAIAKRKAQIEEMEQNGGKPPGPANKGFVAPKPIADNVVPISLMTDNLSMP